MTRTRCGGAMGMILAAVGVWLAVWGSVGGVEAQDAPSNVGANWPQWRGPTGDGHAAAAAKPVTQWTETKNVVWKAAVPGRGHGSPTVWGDRIFLATADERAGKQLLLGYDRKTGAKVFEMVIHEGGLEHAHRKNSQASGTPACDGERVYVLFLNKAGVWVTATDLAGKVAWRQKAGSFKTMHGHGGSPVLHEGKVIVAGDHEDGGFIAALDARTGQPLWRTERQAVASFSTPYVAQVAGKTQVLLSGANVVSSYDPQTGKLIWSCDGPTETTACSMVASGDMVWASGGYPEKEILCIKADGSGDVTRSKVVWRTKRGVTYVPSPLLSGGRLYIVSDLGIVTCFDARTGQEKWRQRLAGAFSASPVLANGMVYVTNEAGRTFVFKDADQYEAVAENQLGSAGFATPAFVGDRVYLRTEAALYCIGLR